MMDAIAQLWLPVLLAAIGVFVASSLIHMLLKWHNSGYRKLENEDAVRAAINAGTYSPGLYVLPYCADMKDMQGEAMQAKLREGPVAFLTVRPSGPVSMGKPLLQWFLLNIVVAAVGGMLAWQYVGPGGNGHAAGHLVGVLALGVYALGGFQEGIWMGRRWSSVLLHALDGVIYAIIVALVFMWLWP
ncbi:MAG: hypothetical protein R3F22_09665 [Lysobacteraceae bacterium]